MRRAGASFSEERRGDVPRRLGVRHLEFRSAETRQSPAPAVDGSVVVSPGRLPVGPLGALREGESVPSHHARERAFRLPEMSASDL